RRVGEGIVHQEGRPLELGGIQPRRNGGGLGQLVIALGRLRQFGLNCDCQFAFMVIPVVLVKRSCPARCGYARQGASWFGCEGFYGFLSDCGFGTSLMSGSIPASTWLPVSWSNWKSNRRESG